MNKLTTDLFSSKLKKIAQEGIQEFAPPSQKTELGEPVGPTSEKDSLGRINPNKGAPQTLDQSSETVHDANELSAGDKVVIKNLFETSFKEMDGQILDVLAKNVFLVYCPDCSRKIHVVGPADLQIEEKIKEKIHEQESTKDVDVNEMYEQKEQEPGKFEMETAPKKVEEREFKNLLQIKDNYPKYVVSMDKMAGGNVKGITHLHILDFLTRS